MTDVNVGQRFLFLFANLVTVLYSSTPEKIANTINDLINAHFQNESLLSNKRPLYAVNMIRCPSVINVLCLIGAPYEDFYSKILGINKKEQYLIHSVSCLIIQGFPMSIILHVHVQCQVHSKDTLTKATQQP